MSMKLTSGTADAALNAIAPLLNNGKLVIYNSSNNSEPTNAGDALNSGVTHTVLATLTFPATAFPLGSVQDDTVTTSRKIVAGTIASVSAVASGDAHFFRCYKSSGFTVSDVVYQGTCGGTGSGQQLELNSVSIISTGNVSVSSLKIVLPTV